MSSIELSRLDILRAIREDLDRAYRDAQKRLDQPRYMVHDGLWTGVEVIAYSGDGQKLGKHKKVGDAINYRQWEADA